MRSADGKIDWRQEFRVQSEISRRLGLDLQEVREDLAHASIQLRDEQERADKLERLADQRLDQVNNTAERLGKAVELLKRAHLKAAPSHRSRLKPLEPGQTVFEVTGQEGLPDWCPSCYVIRMGMDGASTENVIQSAYALKAK